MKHLVPTVSQDIETPYGALRYHKYPDGRIRFNLGSIMEMVMDEFSRYLNDEGMSTVSVSDFDVMLKDFEQGVRNEVTRAKAVRKALAEAESKIKRFD